MGLLAKNPSTRNDKIIQTEVTSMMITQVSPTLAIRPFWLSYPKEDINENAEIFGCLHSLDLPTHFNLTSYMQSYQK